MRATITAVRDQLLIFDSLILYPTYKNRLQSYPESQKGMVELAMKANFFKTSYEIREKTRADMAERWSKKSSSDE
ncbi:hypothetical protein SUGI_0059450 [Cryptomeria japonica]|nr:hypothetical protein SUGI_0059450 [Cryptomeria japonica]